MQSRAFGFVGQIKSAEQPVGDQFTIRERSEDRTDFIGRCAAPIIDKAPVGLCAERKREGSLLVIKQTIPRAERNQLNRACRRSFIPGTPEIS